MSGEEESGGMSYTDVGEKAGFKFVEESSNLLDKRRAKKKITSGVVVTPDLAAEKSDVMVDPMTGRKRQGVIVGRSRAEDGRVDSLSTVVGKWTDVEE